MSSPRGTPCLPPPAPHWLPERSVTLGVLENSGASRLFRDDGPRVLHYNRYLRRQFIIDYLAARCQLTPDIVSRLRMGEAWRARMAKWWSPWLDED